MITVSKVKDASSMDHLSFWDGNTRLEQNTKIERLIIQVWWHPKNFQQIPEGIHAQDSILINYTDVCHVFACL